MRRKLVLVLFLALLCGGVARAQTPALIDYNKDTETSVLAVLVREHCDPRWLSQVLTDSGIAKTEWDKLPPGRAIRLSVPCGEVPPESVVRASKALMVTPRRIITRRSNVRARPAPSSQVAPSPTPPVQSDEALRSLESQAEEQLDQAGKVLKRVNEREAALIQREAELTKAVAGISVRQALVLAAVVVLLLSLAALVWRHHHNRNFIHYQKSLVIKEEGVIYTFVVEHENLLTYQCSKCKMGGIPSRLADLRQHANECPAERVKESVDPSLSS